jgi:hypothetical protein
VQNDDRFNKRGASLAVGDLAFKNLIYQKDKTIVLFDLEWSGGHWTGKDYFEVVDGECIGVNEKEEIEFFNSLYKQHPKLTLPNEADLMVGKLVGFFGSMADWQTPTQADFDEIKEKL